MSASAEAPMPEPMRPMSSPSTSEIARARMDLPLNWASNRPPLTRESDLRLALMVAMSAPPATSSSVMRLSSARSMPSTRSSTSADAPPETSASSSVSAVHSRTNSRQRRPAARLSASGIGWLLSTISTDRPARRSSAAWPCFVTINARWPEGRPGSAPRYMEAAALPMASTAEKRAASDRGSALATAASP